MASLESEREHVINTLSAHYAHDNLTTEQLEALLDQVYKARTPAELAPLVSNLPALPGAAAVPAPRPRAAVAVTPSGAVVDAKRTFAIMSEVVKKGDWIPARVNIVRAVMGSATIDLRDAYLAAGETEFDVKTLMGEIKVIVPPGMRVSCDGFAIMAEFNEFHSSGTGAADAPSIRVHGAAVMGSVNIEERLHGESERDAHRRRRDERRRSR
jgi:hypothetical protein